MFNVRRFKITFELWFHNWKHLHLKPIRECDLGELFKKRDLHKYMSYSFLSGVLILLSIITEMYVRGKGDVVLNMLLILTMLALYDTKNEIGHIDQFIYLKYKEDY